MKIKFLNYQNIVVEIDTDELLFVIFHTETNKKYNNESFHALHCIFIDLAKPKKYLFDNNRHRTMAGLETKLLMKKLDKLFEGFEKYNVGTIEDSKDISEWFIYYKPHLLDFARYDSSGSCYVETDKAQYYVGSSKYVEFIKHLQREIPLSQFG